MFVQVEKGLIIDSNHIEAIEETGELSCTIHTASNSFKVDISLKALVAIIESKVERKETKNILAQMQHVGRYDSQPRP